MKRRLSAAISLILTFAILVCSLTLTIYSQTTSISKLAAFGDSIIYGACQGKATGQNDAYGDQKATDLLAKEFGLTKNATETDKWFTNKAVSGNTTKQILASIQAYDSSLLAQCDVVYMDGGINDAVFNLSEFLSGCGWGSDANEWTFDETKAYIEKYASALESVSNSIKGYFVSIITYIAELENFSGKIIIQNNINPYSGNSNTNAEYLWDEFINRTVTKGQTEAIAATKDVYANVVQLDITSKLRDGAKYTGITYNDSLHLTFPGNRAVYKELSLLLNPDGANLLEFESTEIPETAVWRTLYDFEGYSVGDTSVAGIIKGDVSVADINETADSEGTLKSGYINGSTKVLKSSTASISVDFSSVGSKIYGYRFNILSSEGTSGNAPNTFIPYVTSRSSEVRAFIKTSAENWTLSEYSVDSTITANGQVTSLNISDIQSTTYARIAGANGSRIYYIDDIQVLTADESLPEVTTAPTQPTTPSSTANTTAPTSITAPTTVSTPTTTGTATSDNSVANLTTNEYYNSLSSAISGASAGDTLALLSDITENTGNSGYNISKSVTLDLGGHTLNSTGKRLFNIVANSNAVFTVKNGSITMSALSDIPICVRATNDLVLENITANCVSTGQYGFVTVLSPSTADPSDITAKHCKFSGSNYLFTDNNIANSAWNLYIYDCDLTTSANSVILKKDTAKAYDAVIFSGHIKNALLNANHYPNLKISDNSYMTLTQGGEKDSAVTAFAAEYWVYENDDDSLNVDCSMLAGASIRLGKANGIRFYMTVDQQKIADLRAAGAKVEYGVLITAADILGDEELTLDFTGEVENVEYKSDEYFTADFGFSGIVGSVEDIKESDTVWSTASGNITRAFVGRGYVKVTKDGKTVVSYAEYANGDIANNTRSLQYIANAYKSDVSSNYNEIGADIRALVDKWASAVR